MDLAGPAATPARAAPAVATPRTLVADLRALLRQTRLHRGVPRPLEPDLDVLGGLVPLDLAPTVGQQVLQAGRRGLAEAVATGDLHVQALVDRLFVVGHGRERVAGEVYRPDAASAPLRDNRC